MKLITQLLLFIVILCFMPIMSLAKTQEESLDQIVATVNDTIITESEVDAALQLAKHQIPSQDMPTPAVLRKKVLEQLINRKLQLQLAEQAGIQINDEEVDKAITEIASRNQLT